MSSATIALIALLGATFFWSTANVVGKILLQTFAPFTLAFLRFFLATIVILPFFLKQKPVSFKKLIREVLPISLFSTGNIMLFYLGLTRTTANASAVIYTATPLIVAVLSKILLHERLNFKKTLGIGLGFVGALTIVLLPVLTTGESFSSGDFGGNLLVLLAAFSWALYTIGSQRLAKRYSPLTISTVSIVVSALVFLLLTWFFEQLPTSAQVFVPKQFGLLLHLAILATYLLYQWAILHSSATTVSLSNYLQPVFAVFLGILILGEKLTWGFIIGSVLVFTGVFLTSGAQVLRELSKLWRHLK